MGFDVAVPAARSTRSARSFRKGPDNTADAGPSDPGSPWAIGGADGGHTAVHPELGTVDDLGRAGCARPGPTGIDLALDLAFQCSPDHPWVTEHPEWFRHRPDGTIQYAENPPKKYQDIYPLDFESRGLASAVGRAARRVPCSGPTRACTVFRVDNPHTKPFAFWEWLIGEVQRRHPGTIFLAEAFTRPAVMHRLGQVGFTQAYTYFPWRESKQELDRLLHRAVLAARRSTSSGPTAWPTTPDILPGHLRHAPLEAFALRYFLAATLSPQLRRLRPGLRAGREPSRPATARRSSPAPRSTRSARGT